MQLKNTIYLFIRHKPRALTKSHDCCIITINSLGIGRDMIAQFA